MLFASPPFCVGYAFHASRHGSDKGAALAGLAIALVELCLFGALIVVGLLLTAGG